MDQREAGKSYGDFRLLFSFMTCCKMEYSVLKYPIIPGMLGSYSPGWQALKLFTNREIHEGFYRSKALSCNQVCICACQIEGQQL